MKIKIILPIPLPTWNRILAMHPMQRKKLRDYIHSAICMCTPSDGDSRTLTVSHAKLQSMGWSMQAYLQMIRPSKSRASQIVRKKRRETRRRLSR